MHNKQHQHPQHTHTHSHSVVLPLQTSFVIVVAVARLFIISNLVVVVVVAGVSYYYFLYIFLVFLLLFSRRLVVSHARVPDLIANLVLICQQIKKNYRNNNNSGKRTKVKQQHNAELPEPHLDRTWALSWLSQYLSRRARFTWPPSPTASLASPASLSLSSSPSQPAPVPCN